MKWARSLVARLIELVSLLTPKKGHIVLHGFPADEGNVVEVARGLMARYPGKVYWLVDEPNGWSTDLPDAKLEICPKYSLKALRRYVSAEAVFFTHGLYGDPRPQNGQTAINLWHGDGFKVKKDAERAKRSIYPAQFTVGCTQLLALKRAKDFKMPASSVLVVGNPRMDQFYYPLTPEARSSLGIGQDQKYVVWVPTFRANHGAGVTKGWSDVGENAPNPNKTMEEVAAAVTRAGFLLIVKPHPQDSESRSVPGAVVVDNGDIEAAGATFYTLLGSSAGIITDYSSVWTEYLALNRPIGFVMPDQHEYTRNRGLYPPDLFSWLPGPTLHNSTSIEEFIRELHDPLEADGRAKRDGAAVKLGLAHGEGKTTDNLLDILTKERVFTKAGGLMPASPTKENTGVLIRRTEFQSRAQG